MRKLKTFLRYFGVAFLFFLIGWLSYSNQPVRIKLFYVKDVITSLFKDADVIENYELAPDSIQQIHLLFEQDDLNQLALYRKKATYRNMLYSEEKEKFNGKLIFNNDTVDIEYRLKGGRKDHYEGSKWSIRIKLKDKIEGVPYEFSIQDPVTRNFYNEHLLQKYLSHIGLKTIQYTFCSIKINDTNKGVYALEQSFYPTMFKDHDSGPIYAFNELNRIESGKNEYLIYDKADYYLNSSIKVFNHKESKQLFSDSVIWSGIEKIEKARQGNSDLSKIFDLDKFAKLFITTDLYRAYHAIRWKNMRFYYNLKTQLLEPIPYDGNSGMVIDSALIFELDKVMPNEKYPYYLCKPWMDLFFTNPAFLSLYAKNLNLIFNDVDLNIFDFVEKNRIKTEAWERLFQSNHNLSNNIILNANILSSNFNNNIHFEIEEYKDSIKCKNLSFMPLKIISINDIPIQKQILGKRPLFTPEYIIIKPENLEIKKKFTVVIKDIFDKEHTVEKKLIKI